jgi:hypothetical protein
MLIPDLLHSINMPHRISQKQRKYKLQTLKTTCMIEPINTTEKTNTYLSCRVLWWVSEGTLGMEGRGKRGEGDT